MPKPLNPAGANPLGPVALFVPGVRVTLEVSRPELRCDRAAPMAVQLRARRRALGLTIADAAAIVGVQRWTHGLWETGRQRPQARYRDAIVLFLNCAVVATVRA